jgi:hypothetical protein
MKLSKYIKTLQKMLDEHGDIKLLYTSADAEGNSYNRVHSKPEFRFLGLFPGHSYECPDHLYPNQRKDQHYQEWLRENDLVGAVPIKRVILL